MVKKVLLTTVILLLMTHHAAAQSSDLWLYDFPATGNVKERTTANHQYNVTCIHTPTGHPRFIIRHGGYDVTFIVTNTTPPFGILNGFNVYDMQLDGTTCWVCGSTWEQSATPTYNVDGTYYYTKDEKKGFIAKFDMDDAIAGTANWQYTILEDYKKLTQLATHGNGATAIALSINDSTHIVELIEQSSGAYKRRISKSTFHEEYFMDVVNANGSIVVLVRFNYPPHFMYYRSYFGLRYGSPSNFASTSTKLYKYDTYDPYGYGANFTGLNPIVLSATHKDHGVTVSYIGQNDSQKGRLILYHIPTQGATNLQCSQMGNTGQYKNIIEADFNYPLTYNTFMTVLLEDSTGTSELRFPRPFTGGSFTERYVKTDIYKLLSLWQYQSSSSDIDVYAAGYRKSDSKLTRAGQHLVNTSLCTSNCLTRCTVHSLTNIYTASSLTENLAMHTISYVNNTFTNCYYSTSNSTETKICDDGTPLSTIGDAPTENR